MTFTTYTRQTLIRDLSKHHIKVHQENWSNYMGSVVKRNAVVIEVDNTEQVRQVILAVKRINEKNIEKITIRAAAGWLEVNHGVPCCFWRRDQMNEYNDSFSFSSGAVADVIVLFSKKFRNIKIRKTIKESSSVVSDPTNPILTLPVKSVEVTAGVQIAVLADKLRKQNLSLRTSSMIPWVSAVGLAGTGGHGTGRDEPAFSGQILSMTVCDFNGDIRKISRDDPHFATLCGAHSGLLGIVLKMELMTVQAFNLEETIHNFTSINELTIQLPQFLQNNHYFTLMRTPTYPGIAIDETALKKWQIRLWNYTQNPPSIHEKAAYNPDLRSLEQEWSVKLGDSVENYLMQNDLHELIPYFMQLSAALIMDMRGTDPITDYENHIAHYQASFPKSMRDVSYMIPVKDKEAGQQLGQILTQLDAMLVEASNRNEYPITYAIYVRYLKGTNGGLSSTATNGVDERILAIDMVTHPDAPGISRFEKEFLNYLSLCNIKPRHHLGKNFPAGITTYADFLDEAVLKNYLAALTAWHHGEDNLKKSPFLTPYLQTMLYTKPREKQAIDDLQTQIIEEVSRKCPVICERSKIQFLTRFIDVIGGLDLIGYDLRYRDARLNRDQLMTKCSELRQKLQDKIMQDELQEAKQPAMAM